MGRVSTLFLAKSKPRSTSKEFFVQLYKKIVLFYIMSGWDLLFVHPLHITAAHAWLKLASSAENCIGKHMSEIRGVILQL